MLSPASAASFITNAVSTAAYEPAAQEDASCLMASSRGPFL